MTGRTIAAVGGRLPGRLPALAVSTLLGVVVVTATGFTVRAQVEEVYRAQDAQLGALSDARVDQVLAWRAERSADARVTAGSPLFADAVNRWLVGRDPATGREIEQTLRLVREAHQYEDVQLLTPAGDVLASAVGLHATFGSTTLRLVQDAVTSGAPRLGDMLHDDDPDHLHLDIAVPVPSPTGRSAAVMLLRADPGATLLPRLGRRLTDDVAGETALVRRDDDRAVIVSIAGHGRPVSIATVDIADERVVGVQAALGRSERVDGIDLHGVPVVADAREVTGTEWWVVTKAPASIIAGRAVERAGLVVLLVLLLSAGVAAAVALAYAARRRDLLRRLRAAEEARSAIASHFARVFALARDAFLLIDPDGRIVEANEAAESFYGRPRDELLGLRVHDLRAPEAPPHADTDWVTTAGPAGVQYETVHQRRDGTTFPVEISARALEIDGRPYRQGIVRDITDRTRHATAQAEQLEELRRWYAAALGREQRVIALKAEVDELLGALGRPRRYPAVVAAGSAESHAISAPTAGNDRDG